LFELIYPVVLLSITNLLKPNKSIASPAISPEVKAESISEPPILLNFALLISLDPVFIPDQ